MILQILLLVITAMPLQEAQKPYELEGVWERKGDSWEGMQVAVEKVENGYEAQIILLPAHARNWGFANGDKKWKNFIKSTEQNYVFQDLYINKIRRRKYYQSTRLRFESDDTIKTILIKTHDEWIGQEQTWVRITDPEI